jgi:signal transduction protein with GAF and PtsI domain
VSARTPPPEDQIGELLAAIAARATIAKHLEPPALDRLLRSIVTATVELFDAEAASIALLGADGRLKFRVAAGPHGQGVIGLSVAVGEGIAGYVQQTGQPLALSDVSSDPRFGRDTAERTGYIPRSVLAVPLELDDQVIGVLEVLDKRGDAGFDLSDLSRAGIFARQAAVAIDVVRVDREVTRLLADGLEALAREEGKPITGEQAEAIVAASKSRASSSDDAFWTFVDRLAALRSADQAHAALVADLLEVAVAHLPGRGPGHASAGRTWRDRVAADELGE